MKNLLHHAAFLLVTLGAVNWGLVGLFDVNLVSLLFKAYPLVEKGAYILIGLAGLFFAADHAKEHNLM